MLSNIIFAKRVRASLADMLTSLGRSSFFKLSAFTISTSTSVPGRARILGGRSGAFRGAGAQIASATAPLVASAAALTIAGTSVLKASSSKRSSYSWSASFKRLYFANLFTGLTSTLPFVSLTSALLPGCSWLAGSGLFSSPAAGGSFVAESADAEAALASPLEASTFVSLAASAGASVAASAALLEEATGDSVFRGRGSPSKMRSQ
mmetsp:Transcript_84409/g.154503  ORF Transcript_84409/g.154503 Transcript_84409/m.154503 type:complete len:207 (+) Transcript_84409:193-813(+)